MKESLNKEKLGHDVCLLGALVLLALLIFVFFRLKSGQDGSELLITVSGEEVIREKLVPGKEYRIESEDGGYNIIKTVSLQNGETGIICTDANCPNHDCIEKGLVTETGIPVICLPHRLSAKIL